MTIDEFNNLPDDPRGLLVFRQQSKPQQQQPQKKKKNFFLDQISTLGGIVGGVGGSFIAPIAGTAGGAAIGSGLGEALENLITGDKVTKNVGKEAALGGVFGGGPLRLIKAGAGAVKGIKAGQGLTDVITQAGQNAAQSSIRGTVGSKLTGASDDLVVKNFRLTPTQLNNFRTKYGEDASQVIKRYNLVGKSSDDISEKVIKPLQDEFDAISGQIPGISRTALEKSFANKYRRLIGSAVEDNQAIGKQVQTQAKTILKKYGDVVDAKELTTLRREFDSLVTYADKTANPARYGVNKRAADAIRNTLQDAADKAGLSTTTGKTFKELGQEISKVRRLTDNIGKQEQLGRGSLPAGLPTLLGGVAGAATGGGMLAGLGTAIGVNAVNSPGGRRLAAGVTQGLGNRLTQSGANLNPAGPKSITRRVGTVGVASGLYNQAQQNQNQSLENALLSSNESSNGPQPVPGIGLDDYINSYNEPNSTQNATGISLEDALLAMQEDLATTGGKNIDKIEKIYKFANQGSSVAKKPQSADSAKVTSNANIGLRALDDLENTIASNPSALRNSVIPGRGALGGLPGRLLGTQQLDAARQQIIDVIARLRTGAAITNDEARRFTQFLPVAADTPDVQSQKLGYLRQQFNEILSRTSQGTTPSNLEDALLQGAF